MLIYIKTYIRDILPARYQVTVKYFYNWFFGDLEEEMIFLDLIVKGQDLVIDIGGNRGVFTYRFWKLGADVEVFEPNPNCVLVLSAWAAGKQNVHVHQVALSSVSGSANLHIPVDDSGVEHDASASIENIGSIHTRDQLVELKTLDSYNFHNVSMIKIDVEGHESSVIAGAEATIKSSFPAILIEIEQRHNSNPIGDMFNQIRQLGYEGFYLKNGCLISLDDFDVEKNQSPANLGVKNADYINNFLFLNKSRLAAGDYAELTKLQA